MVENTITDKEVKCKLCDEVIENPLNAVTNGWETLNMSLYHFTKKHAKKLREFLKTKTLADIFGEDDENDENDLYPVYFETYPDGNLLSASIEINDLLVDFITDSITVNDNLGKENSRVA